MKQPGRPPKLDDRQKAEIGRRLAVGEKAADLAREFKVGKATISRLFSERTETIQTLAQSLADTEIAIDSLPVSERSSIRSLADQLKGISSSLARAAQSGSNVAARLSGIAEQRASMLDHESDAEDLKPVAALMETANRASSIGMGLLTAGKNFKPDDGNAPAIRVSREDESL